MQKARNRKCCRECFRKNGVEGSRELFRMIQKRTSQEFKKNPEIIPQNSEIIGGKNFRIRN